LLFFLFRLQDSDDDISHLEWETVRVRLIKAGTLEKLVESLASDTGELESTYVNVFLATYRTFSTASQILALIAKRYADLNNPTVMEAVRLQHKKYANFCVSQCDMTMMMLSHVFHIFN
jgi:ral guanine nucleotide dissociation stimulator-like 1